MSNAIQHLTRIVQKVALVDSADEQVKLIVESIAQTLAVDVCSLYRVNHQQEMLLLASHGLASISDVVIPAGKGLVGLVAHNRHSINIANAAEHPNYYYLPQTLEERFQSFCGAPLVSGGEVIGVLVVQSYQPQSLSQDNEALLVTLASQLAFIVANIPNIPTDANATKVYTQGVTGSQGIAIGKVLLSVSGDLNAVVDAVSEDKHKELFEWRQLLSDVKAEITEERASISHLLTADVSQIFDSYLLLLSDKVFIARMEAEILAGHWLPSALRVTIQYFAELFHSIDDPYLKARYEDIQYLGNKLFNSWRGVSHKPCIHAEDDAVILVGAQVSVSEIANIANGKLVGIVCFAGSSLSHTAVVANALGVPAIMGVGEIKNVQSGTTMILDADSVQIILNPGEMLLTEYQKLILQATSFKQQLFDLRDLPAQTLDGTCIRLLTNTGLLADISPGLKNGAEGVGLYRTEIPFMVRDSFPSEDEQVKVYQQVLAAYRDKPVCMRTLDIGGDKQLPYFPMPYEENPALGWRGIRFTLDNIQLLMTQVRAMLRAAEGQDNLRILLPMVTSSQEIDHFSDVLNDAIAQLLEEGLTILRPEIGVMIEVPAAISQIAFWKDKIDFIAIGSNDLSQYLLAIDRNNTLVANYFEHVHPAVLQEIYRIILLAKKHQLGVSICGEMAADPIAVVLLLGMGMRQLSMSAEKLLSIKWLIRSLSIVKAEALAQQALTMDNSEQIKQLVKKTIKLSNSQLV